MKAKQILTFFFFLLNFCCFFTCKKDSTRKTSTNANSVIKTGLVRTPDSIYQQISTLVTAPGTISLPRSHILEIPSMLIQEDTFINSCVSIACAEQKSIADHYQYSIPYPNNQFIYSPSYLFDQDNVHLDGNCISGSFFKNNLDVMLNKGICTLADFPYDGSNPNSCLVSYAPNLDDKAAEHKIYVYYKIDPINVAELKSLIYAGYPVTVAHIVDDNFEFCFGKYIWKNLAGQYWGDHAGTIYGYDDSIGAFKMLNPWGKYKGWGDNGSIWVDYNFLENGFDTYNKVNKKVFF